MFCLAFWGFAVQEHQAQSESQTCFPLLLNFYSPRFLSTDLAILCTQQLDWAGDMGVGRGTWQGTGTGVP